MYVEGMWCIKTVDFTAHAVSDLCALQPLSLCVHRCRLRDFRSRVFPGAEKKARDEGWISDHRGRERLDGRIFSRIFCRAYQGFSLTAHPRLIFIEILIVH